MFRFRRSNKTCAVPLAAMPFWTISFQAGTYYPFGGVCLLVIVLGEFLRQDGSCSAAWIITTSPPHPRATGNTSTSVSMSCNAFHSFSLRSLTEHPPLRFDLCKPILRCGNVPKIFLDVLFAHIANGDQLSLAVFNGHAEQLLAQENALRVVAKSAVTKVGQKSFRLVKPGMNRKIVLGLSAEFRRTTLCVLQRVGPDYTSYVETV
jgi:hypothetical protein